MSTLPQARSWWLSFPGIMLALGIVSGAWAWQIIALPVFELDAASRHPGHFLLTFLHALGGSLVLTLGSLNLYIGSTRRWFRFHRQVGFGYLFFGTLTACLAMFVALSRLHAAKDASMAIDLARVSNIGWSLAMLSLAWLGAAAMAWRAARNRRYENHRDWMIRSYVLAWSFVLCRVADRVPGMEALPALGDGQAFIWISWILPLGLAELAIQWRAGARLTRSAAAAPSPR
jgi:hypothetical protein